MTWFNNGNIFHIKQEQFWTVFQQHRKCEQTVCDDRVLILNF